MLSPPPVRKTISVIYGGLVYNEDSMIAIKAHRRKALQPIALIFPNDAGEHLIRFIAARLQTLVDHTMMRWFLR